MFNCKVWSGVLIASISCVCIAQVSKSEPLKQQGQSEFSEGHFPAAERILRKITADDPSNIVAQIYLGEALFRQQKYTDAIVPFEKALSLEQKGSKLSTAQRRILIDALAMSYGISGKLNDARSLLNDAIKSDPGYPINYYNLACVFAEQNNKSMVLQNLAASFERRNGVLPGEQMPDPRSDSSFQKYQNDKDFLELVKEYEPE